MRHILIAAAALAVSGFVATTVAQAQTFQAGGPQRVANMCKVTTDDMGNDSFGYYEPCGQQAVASAPRGKR